MARKKHHVEHPDERWLLTYADMITLLMALFMVLYAMSMVNTSKFEKLKLTLKDAFTSPAFVGGTSILDVGAAQSSQSTPQSDVQGRDTLITDLQNRVAATPQATPATAKALDAARAASAGQEEQLRTARRQLKRAIAQAGQARNVRVTIDERGLVIRLITDRVLFASGSYQLQTALEPLLTTIAGQIDRLPNSVRVEGYTDAVPCACPFGNLGLSSMRAAAVLTYFGAHGFDAARHSASVVGFGDRHPRVRNAPDGSGPANRRVEIVLVRRQFDATTGGAQSTDAPGSLGDPIAPAPVKLTG